MAIRSGIGARLFLDQYDLSGDVGSIGSINGGTNLQEIPVLQDVAMRRLSLLRDGAVDFSAYFNGSTGGSAPVLEDLPGNATQITVASGSVVGYDTWSMLGLQATYDTVRGQDGSLVLNTNLMANATATESGELLTTGLQTFASSGAGSVLTYSGVSTAFGLVAYLHATALTSGTATVAIQDSTDNISYGNVTGGGFTAITGPTKQRIATAKDLVVKKYVKINITGTFVGLKVVVAFIRYRAVPHP